MKSIALDYPIPVFFFQILVNNLTVTIIIIFTFLFRNFSMGRKCAKCSREISKTDWVRKAKHHVYHLACFACHNCKRQLSTGEEFGLHEGQVLCKVHYQELFDGGTTSSDGKFLLQHLFHLSKLNLIRIHSFPAVYLSVSINSASLNS